MTTFLNDIEDRLKLENMGRWFYLNKTLRLNYYKLFHTCLNKIYVPIEESPH